MTTGVAILIVATTILGKLSDWAGVNTAATFEIEYKVTDSCEIQVISVESDPEGLEISLARSFMRYVTSSESENRNWDFIYKEVPGAKQEPGINLFNKQRILTYDDKKLVCTFDGNDQLKSAVFQGESKDQRPLASLAAKKHTFRITFESDGI